MQKNLVLALILAYLPIPPVYADMDSANQLLKNGDYARAAEEFRKLADEGNAKAQSNLGYMYYAGEGVPQSFAEAVTWYRKAAVQGDKDAQYNLAVAYAFGEGVQQDYKEAAIWYRRAAEQGHAVAQYSLGVSYAYGEGVEQDQKTAAEWFLKAAQAGYENAQAMVGSLYHTGEGLPKDYAQAAAWYRKAAERGNASAQYNLGTMYRAGKGVEKNNDEAIKWLRLAADQGYEAAQNELSGMERTMAAASREKTAVVPAAPTPAVTTPAVTPATAPAAAVTSTADQSVTATTGEPTAYAEGATPSTQRLVEQAEKPTPAAPGVTPAVTKEPAPQSIQETIPATVTVPAPLSPPVTATPVTEVADATEEAQTSDTSEEQKQGGVFSGLKKFFTQTRETETADSVPATDVQEVPASSATSPIKPEPAEVAARMVTETETQAEPAPAPAAETVMPAKSQEPAAATSSTSTTVRPPKKAASTAPVYPSAESLTSDFHKILGDKKKPQKAVQETGETVAYAEGTAPATQHLADHPEPASAAAPESQPEIAPVVVETETTAQPQDVVRTEPAETTSILEPQEHPDPAETTEQSGVLHGLLDKFFGKKNNASSASQRATSGEDEAVTGATTETDTVIPGADVTAEEATPVTETTQPQTQAVTESSGAEPATPETPEEPLVLARAEPESREVPLAETAEQKLAIDLDTLTARAVEGDAEAQFQLGKSYYLGSGVKQDYSLAFLWFRRAALQGHADAQYNLGTMYLMGEGIDQSDTEAIDWYDKAAAQGHATARNNLEKLQQLDRQQEAPAETTEVAAVEEETAEGKGGVLAYVGKFFKSGDEDEDVEAEDDYEESYDDMAPGEVTTVSAVTNEQAANLAPGQYDYERGLAYSDGKGVPQDYATAFKLFQSAAQQNYLPAQFHLANVYMSGQGTEKDPEAAVEWYEKAARQGYTQAQRTLGSMYLHGNGVKLNKPLALAWYSILSSTGNVLDIHRRDVLMQELSESEVQESEKLKRELAASLPHTRVSN